MFPRIPSAAAISAILTISGAMIGGYVHMIDRIDGVHDEVYALRTDLGTRLARDEQSTTDAAQLAAMNQQNNKDIEEKVNQAIGDANKAIYDLQLQAAAWKRR